MRKFRKFVMMNQKELKAKLEKILKAHYKNVINEDGFLYAKGSKDCPILLTAHMDTVHKETVKRIDVVKEKGVTIISSPQGIGGDDRCGIWMIYKVLTTTKYRPSILFCEDEEIGGVGSEKFADTPYIEDLENLKYLVELDRANADDAVYYNCGNKDFQKYIHDIIGYELAYGSFSDIGHLSPACDRASVNLSCGYYRQHTLEEYVIFEEMQNTLEKVKILLANSKDCESYDYQEYDRYASLRNWRQDSYWYDSYWRTKYNYDYEEEEEDCTTALNELLDDDDSTYKFQFYKSNGCEETFVCDAASLVEAVGKLMMQYPDITWNNVFDYAAY